MHVALIITDEDFYEPTGYAQAWVDALEAQGAEVTRVAAVDPTWAFEPRPAFDLAIAHVLVEEVAAFRPTMKAAALLEASGVPLVNPLTSIVASSDKLTTHAVWAAAGLEQPRTFELAGLERWPDGFEALVLKPSLSDGARHIEVVHDLETALRRVTAWREDEARGGERRGAALLQEVVDEPQVVRLFATPQRCSKAYGKSREPGEIVTHGTVYPDVYDPPPAMAELAQRMVATLGGGLMGVDVLVAQDGRHVALEANAPFGFDVTDPDQGRWVAAAALERAGTPLAARADRAPLAA